MTENNIYLIDVKSDNITDYIKTSLLLVFPYCSGKCKGCQNYELQKKGDSLKKQFKIDSIISYYDSLTTHEAIVCAGLEPFDSFNDLYLLVENLFSDENRNIDFVIYTGYYKEEIENLVNNMIKLLKDNNKSLIIKYGRYDETDIKEWKSNILGVKISTKNQYIEKYIKENNIINCVIETYNAKEI